MLWEKAINNAPPAGSTHAILPTSQDNFFMFSFIGSLDAALLWRIGNALWVCRLSEALKESRQFIGWWRGCHPRCRLPPGNVAELRGLPPLRGVSRATGSAISWWSSAPGHWASSSKHTISASSQFSLGVLPHYGPWAGSGNWTREFLRFTLGEKCTIIGFFPSKRSLHTNQTTVLGVG